MSKSLLDSANNNTPPGHPGGHRGFIVFCETNLRYEKGFKAWLFVGPYLLGALLLDQMTGAKRPTDTKSLALWIGFLAYLILFPVVWQKVLRVRSSRK